MSLNTNLPADKMFRDPLWAPGKEDVMIPLSVCLLCSSVTWVVLMHGENPGS